MDLFSDFKMALGRGKLIGVIGDEDTCVGNETFNHLINRSVVEGRGRKGEILGIWRLGWGVRSIIRLIY